MDPFLDLFEKSDKIKQEIEKLEEDIVIGCITPESGARAAEHIIELRKKEKQLNSFLNLAQEMFSRTDSDYKNNPLYAFWFNNLKINKFIESPKESCSICKQYFNKKNRTIVFTLHPNKKEFAYLCEECFIIEQKNVNESKK